MKRQMIIFLVILLALMPLGVQAGKPKPTPYPEIEVEMQSYPPPEVPPEYPDAPDEFCDQPMEVCVWGYFMGRWWVSINYLEFDLDGDICIMSTVTYKASCFPLNTHGYDGFRTFYETGIFDECGNWMVYYAILGEYTATEIRQPNTYKTICNFFPSMRKG